MKLKLYKSTGVRKNAITKNPPAGTVTAYAGTVAPDGWLLCNGASVSTTTYADLFSAISTTYGGSGGSFTLPDLRGRVPYGATSVGTAAGSETVSLSTTQIGEPGHTHTFTETAHSHTATETAHKHAIYYSNITSAAGAYYARTVGGSSTVLTNSTGTTTQYNKMGFSTILNQPTEQDVDFSPVAFSIAAAAIAATPHTNIQPSLYVSYIIKT